MKEPRRKIAVLTGTRAEFGLLYWLIKSIQQDPDLELLLIVTGMHLSPEFGLTYKTIEESGIPISEKVEILLSSDSEIGISKSIGLGIISFAEVFSRLKPDILVLLGDRFEAFAAASAAMIAKLPTAHIHGGEATEGLIDEPIRHSITKMSHLHFTATEVYRQRVIQLGEQPDRVFNTGTPGLDNIDKLKLLSKSAFEDSIGFQLGQTNFLVTFHPVTLEDNSSKAQFEELLNAVDEFPASKVIFTKPNADTSGRIIIDRIDQYTRNNPERSIAFTSLGQLRYLSALSHIDAVIGNSSSGLIEAPSFQIATVNIGDRQKGRIKAESVFDCLPEKDSISSAIKIVLSEDFQTKLRKVKNPYGEGGASAKILEILKSYPLAGIIKKEFYDIKL